MVSLPEMLDPQLLARWDELSRQPRLPRLHPATLRGAWWAWRAFRRARRDLSTDGLTAVVPAPPPLPWGARTGVYGVLQRLSPTCLERCVVTQRWLAAHGIVTQILIGVRNDEAGKVAAHAWIDETTEPDEYEGFTVIHRIPA